VKRKLELGAEPKKVIILGTLLVLAAFLIWRNMTSEPSPPEGAVRTPPAAALKQKLQPVAVDAEPAAPIALAPTSRGATSDKVKPGGRKAASQQDFKPSLKARGPEERLDPTTVDPTLRLDLLAKLSKVTVDHAERSLFDFSQAPPKQPEPKIEVKPVAKAKPFIGPMPPPPPTPVPTPTPRPQPPPLPFKFYGLASPKAGGAKRVFLLDGEEILTPAEGETIKRKFRIVRVGVNSVVIQNLDFETPQTLTMEEPAG
jgi:hypothetical protein